MMKTLWNKWASIAPYILLFSFVIVFIPSAFIPDILFAGAMIVGVISGVTTFYYYKT